MPPTADGNDGHAVGVDLVRVRPPSTGLVTSPTTRGDEQLALVDARAAQLPPVWSPDSSRRFAEAGANELEPLAGPDMIVTTPVPCPGMPPLPPCATTPIAHMPASVAAAEAVVLVVHDDDVAEAEILDAEPLDRVAVREHDVAVRPLRAHPEAGAHQVRGDLGRDLDAKPAVAAVRRSGNASSSAGLQLRGDDLREVEQPQPLPVRADEQPVARREHVERARREVDEHERVLADDRALGARGRPVETTRTRVADAREELQRLVAPAVGAARGDARLEVIRRPGEDRGRRRGRSRRRRTCPEASSAGRSRRRRTSRRASGG